MSNIHVIQFPEESEMASQYVKGWSTSLVIREMKINTIIIYHYTSTMIKKIKNLKIPSVGKTEEKPDVL